MSELRVRYAPSPTGHLHIGGARTALLNYLMARANNGKFIIRFEDTDQSRHVESGIDSQLQGLRWLGIDWDESVDIGGPYAPYRQLQRLELYQVYIQKLIANQHAYYCYCKEHELEDERKQQESRGETPKYGGRCRKLTTEQIQAFRSEGRIPSLRFHVPLGQIISFMDRVRGHIEFESEGMGDFIIVRPDGIPTYNFAVILDDYLMKISLVIRGEEHLSNTPRQILLYQALQFPIPDFAHLSLILNKDRKKMSKRDESIIQFIEQYRERGYLPEAVLNFIVLLGWSPEGEEELFSREELIHRFSLERVSKSPAIFDMDKLNWMNSVYIKKAPLEDIVELTLPHLQKAGYISHEFDKIKREWVNTLIRLYQDRLQYASEIVELTRLFFIDEMILDDEAKAVMDEPHVPLVLRSFQNFWAGAATYTVEQIASLIKNVQAETGIKGKQLFMSIRVATTGQLHGPDLNMTLHLLGQHKVLDRINKLL